MSEEINTRNTENNGAPKGEPEMKASAIESRADKLREIAALINKTDKSAEARRGEIEKRVAEGERERERRIAEAQERMRENSERARRAANERAARLEYGGEYRQTLMARENRKAAAEARKRAEERAEAERRASDERRLMIEEFMRRESEESARRAEESERILNEARRAPERAEAAELCTLEKTPVTEEDNTPKDCEKSYTPSAQEAKTAEKDENRGNTAEKEINEPILLNIRARGASGATESDAGKIMLNISGVAPAQAHLFPEYTPIYAPQRRENRVNNDGGVTRVGEMRTSGEPQGYRAATAYGGEYTAMRRTPDTGRLDLAVGEYGEELRLLREEEARYAEEIDALRDKRYGYAEERERMSAAGTYDEEPYLAYSEAEFPSRERAARKAENESKVISDYEAYELAERERRAMADFESSYREDAGFLDRDNEDRNLSDENAAKKFDEQKYFDEEHELLRRSEDERMFAKAELKKRLERYSREERSLMRRVSDAEIKQRHSAGEDEIRLIVEKISAQKRLCELAFDALAACVYASASAKTSKHKKLVEAHIEKYNYCCDEYERVTGDPVSRIPHGTVSDILAGRAPAPIIEPRLSPLAGPVSYGARDTVFEPRGDYRYDSDVRDFERSPDESPAVKISRAERRSAEKKRAERMNAIKRAAERDILLVSLRCEYELSALESERDMLINSYGADQKKMGKRITAIERKIEKLKISAKRAVKLEGRDNSRYYTLIATDPRTERTKATARRERLSSLRSRLEVLLREREDINERLITLYGGGDKKLRGVKISRKAGAVRRKSAKAMYRKQRAQARKIEKFRVPLDLKDRAYEQLNRKTACASAIEEAEFRIARLKLRGNAKRELLADIKRQKAEMRAADREFNYILKKMKKHEERNADDRSWAALLITLAVVAALGIGAWYLWGDGVVAYFGDLVRKLSR